MPAIEATDAAESAAAAAGARARYEREADAQLTAAGFAPSRAGAAIVPVRAQQLDPRTGLPPKPRSIRQVMGQLDRLTQAERRGAKGFSVGDSVSQRGKREVGVVKRFYDAKGVRRALIGWGTTEQFVDVDKLERAKAAPHTEGQERFEQHKADVRAVHDRAKARGETMGAQIPAASRRLWKTNKQGQVVRAFPLKRVPLPHGQLSARGRIIRDALIAAARGAATGEVSTTYAVWAGNRRLGDVASGGARRSWSRRGTRGRRRRTLRATRPCAQRRRATSPRRCGPRQRRSASPLRMTVGSSA